MPRGIEIRTYITPTDCKVMATDVPSSNKGFFKKLVEKSTTAKNSINTM